MKNWDQLNSQSDVKNPIQILFSLAHFYMIPQTLMPLDVQFMIPSHVITTLSHVIVTTSHVITTPSHVITTTSHVITTVSVDF